MDGHGFKFLERLEFFELRDVGDEVAVDVKSLQVREVTEIIVELDQVVMRNVDPLQVMTILHNSFQNAIQSSQLPNFVVAEHEGDTD